MNLIVGGVAALAAALGTHYVTRSFFAKKSAVTADATMEGGWKHYNVAGLDFDAPPIQLTRTDLTRMLPIETQNRTLSMEAFLTEPANAQFQVSALRTTLKPQVPLDLSAAMRGALQNVAASAHASLPELKFEESALGDVLVKRGQFDGSTGKEKIHVEIVGLQHGQTMWQVQVAFASETRRHDAERLLNSIRPPRADTRGGGAPAP